MAEEDKVSSIAFPTVGCGKLGFDPKSVAHCFLRAQRNTQSTVQIYIVAYETALQKAFKFYISAPEIRIQHIQPVKSSFQMLTDSSRTLKIKVQSGSLPDFEADVLVNVIASQTSNLAKAGAVSSCFLQSAGPALQREFSNSFPPSDFGRDVTMTSAVGLQAKCIYHAAVRPHRDKYSLTLLYDTIKLCLVKASAASMTSIAFPTVGCGRLGYDPRDVADSFMRALRDSGCQLQVYIVSFDDQLCRQFKTYISAPFSESVGHALHPATTAELIDVLLGVKLLGHTEQ